MKVHFIYLLTQNIVNREIEYQEYRDLIRFAYLDMCE